MTEGNRLREVRAVEVLERTDAQGAQRLLEELSKGDPAARLTREATEALAHKNSHKN